MEADDALLPELEIGDAFVRFRGFKLSYVQKVNNIKDTQFPCVCYLDSTAPTFEYNLE